MTKKRRDQKGKICYITSISIPTEIWGHFTHRDTLARFLGIWFLSKEVPTATNINNMEVGRFCFSILLFLPHQYNKNARVDGIMLNNKK